MRVKFIPDMFDKSTAQDYLVDYKYQTVGEYFDQIVKIDRNGFAPIITGKEATWDDIPCADDEIIFVPALEGGGFFGLIGGALLTALSFIPGFQFLLPIGISLMAGALLSFASSMFFKPDTPTAQKQSATYSWDGIQNTIGDGSTMPIVYGKHRVGGVPIEAFVEGPTSQGRMSNKYLNILLAVSEGPVEDIDTDTVQINKQPLSNYRSIQKWRRLGYLNQDTIDEFNKVVTSYNITGVQLTYNIPYIYKTQNEVNAVRCVVSFTGLCNFSDEGDMQKQDCAFHWEWKDNLNPDDFWHATEDTRFWARTNSKVDFCKYIKFDHKSQYLIRVTRIYGDNTNPKIYDKSYFTTVNEIEHAALTYPNTALLGFSIKATNRLSGSFPNVTAIVKGRTLKDVRTGEVAYSNNPANILYDILTNQRYGLGRVMDESHIDMDSLKTFANWCDQYVTYRYYNGSIKPWSATKTYALGALAYDPATDYDYKSIQADNLNHALTNTLWWEKVGENFYITTTEKRYEINMVLDTQFKAIDIISKICGTCRALPFWNGDKFKVVIERPDTPAQMFNMSNIVKDSFEETYTGLADVPNQAEAIILDEKNDYARKTITGIDRDRIDEPPNTRQLNLFGITRLSRARRELVFALKKAKAIRKFISFETGIGGVICEVGDLFYFQHDVPQYGFGGSIETKVGYVVTFGKGLSVTAGKQYTLRIRRKNNTFYVDTWTAPSTTTITERTLESGNNVQVGDIWAFGEINKEAKPFRALSITRKDNKTVAIQAEEYNESIFSDDESIDVEEFDYSQLNLVEEYELDGTVEDPEPVPIAVDPDDPVASHAVPPLVTEVNLSESQELVGDVWVPNIQVSYGPVEMRANSRATIDHYIVMYAVNPPTETISNDDAIWTVAGTAVAGLFTIRNVKIGMDYYIVVKPVTNYGVTNRQEQGDHAFDNHIKPLGKELPPAPPTDLTVIPGNMCNVIKWKPSPNRDVAQYEIWCSTPTNNRDLAELVGTSTGLRNGNIVWAKWVHNDLESNMDYYYWIKAIDAHGNESLWEPLGGGAHVHLTANPNKVLPLLVGALGTTHLDETTGGKFNSIEYGATVGAKIGTNLVKSDGVTQVTEADLMLNNLLARTITLDTNGKFVSAASGARFEITKTLIAGYDASNEVQFKIRASDGKAVAGGGGVVLSSVGITLDAYNGSGTNPPGSPPALPSEITWVYDGNVVASVRGQYQGSANYYSLDLKAGNGSSYARLYLGTGPVNDEIVLISDYVYLYGKTIAAGLNTDLSRDTDDSYLNLHGGTSVTAGAAVSLFGRDHASYPGNMYLTFGGYTSTGKLVVRRRDNSAYTSVFEIDNAGNIVTSALRIGAYVNDSYLAICAGEDGLKGASLTMYGRAHATLPGEAILTLGGYNAYGTFTIRHRLTDESVSTKFTFTKDANLSIGGASMGMSATNTVCIMTGVAPLTSPTDAFQMFSKDIVGGNACPHILTEAGDLIRLYSTTYLADVDATTLTALTGAYGTAGSAIADVGTSFNQNTLNNNFRRLKDLANDLRTVVVSLRTRVNGILARLESVGLMKSS
jgi:predicted phage tail protein